MVPILGKPVMEYIIEHLARYGVKDIMVSVAFNHWKIENYFGDGHRWGTKHCFTPSKALVSTAKSCPSPWARRAACAAFKTSVAFRRNHHRVVRRRHH